MEAYLIRLEAVDVEGHRNWVNFVRVPLVGTEPVPAEISVITRTFEKERYGYYISTPKGEHKEVMHFYVDDNGREMIGRAVEREINEPLIKSLQTELLCWYASAEKGWGRYREIRELWCVRAYLWLKKIWQGVRDEL